MTLINDGRPFRSRDAAHHFTSKESFKEALRVGLLRWVVRSIAVDAAVPDSRTLRAQAAHLVVPPDAVACDDYAAFILGAHTEPPGLRWEHRPMYLVAHSTYVSRPEYALVRQSIDIQDADVTEIEGVRLTTPVRTASDLLRLRYRPYALAAGDAMYRADLINPVAVAEHLRRLSHVRGIRQARELVHHLTPDSESHGESWMRCRILDAGFPKPAIQFTIHDSRGVVRRFDLAYEEFRAAIEYDGREHHSASLDRELDEDRRDDFRWRLGWRFLIGLRENIFGQNPAFETELGTLIGRSPLSRRWY